MSGGVRATSTSRSRATSKSAGVTAGSVNRPRRRCSSRPTTKTSRGTSPFSSQPHAVPSCASFRQLRRIQGVDDDTLPVIDLDDDEDEPGAAAMPVPVPAPVVEVPPVPWRRRHSPRWVRRTAVAMLLATVASATVVGGKAWSTMDRGVAVYTGPRAGDFADRLRCAGDPRVKNDFDFYGTAPLPGERSLPTPPGLRDRSFGATTTRTAHDAARWLNANTDAAATFRKTDIAAWDRATVLQLARAEEWMRSWWSRRGHTAPPGWTEDAAVAALRQAVRDDRFLTE